MSVRATGPVAGILWHSTARSSRDRIAAAADLAQVVLGLPQPATGTPTALRSGRRDAPISHAQVGAPIGAVVSRERLTTIGWGDDIDGWAAEVREGLRKENPAVRSEIVAAPRRRKASRGQMSGRSRKPQRIYNRPGEGGRPHNPVPEPVDLVRDLVPALGTAYRVISAGKGAQLFVWDARAEDASDILDPDGDTIIHGRLSTLEIRRKDPIVGHIVPPLELCERVGLRVRMVIMAVALNGTRDYDDRADWAIAQHALDAGWLQHVVWRGGDRIARDVIPAETYYRTLKATGVSLWISNWGTKVKWIQDRGRLRMENVMNAEERDSIVQRTQQGALIKGPMQGLGWLGHVPFGTRRLPDDRLVCDEEAWPMIRRAFELAKDMNDASGASTRRVVEQLAAENPRWAMDHDRLRTLVQDPMYVTGEFYVRVRDVLVEQNPIEFPDPIPATWFQTIQDLFALRQGRSERTPLGEFALNYVEVVHERCNGERNKRGHRALIKGYNLSNGPDSPTPKGRYRHAPFAPQNCKHKGYTWGREELEHPVIRALLQVVDTREIEDALGSVLKYDPASPTRDHREEIQRLKRQREILTAAKVAAEQRYVDQLLVPDGLLEVEPHVALERELTPIEQQLNAIERRLEAIEERQRAQDPQAQTLDRARKDALREILTLDPPADPRMRILRARVIQKLLSKVVISEDEHGRTWLHLYGHLLPGGLPSLEPTEPIVAAAQQLDAYLRDLGRHPDNATLPQWVIADTGEPSDEEAELAAALPSLGLAASGATDDNQSRTDLEARDTKSVRKPPKRRIIEPSDLVLDDIIAQPSVATAEREAAAARHSWHRRMENQPPNPVPAWQWASIPIRDGDQDRLGVVNDKTAEQAPRLPEGLRK